ncbi:MAG TPA: PfkB family carbohydrate kinase [Armatimonadota bacterium]|nr:PfkB family carbohydrate kinase [Armatimonadota bacterium]
MMTAERLSELLERFASRRVAVVGDYFLDKYLEFDPTLAEISLETVKLANQVVSVRHSPGAAGNVVSNLVALGAGEVIPIGFTGEDGEGFDLRKDLRDLGCNTGYLLQVPERRTPTYLKPRDCRVPELDGESERFDIKNRELLPAEVEDALVDILEALVHQVDAFVIADQVDEPDCGVISAVVRDTLSRLAKEFPEVTFWADSRRRAGSFHGIVIKPNQEEAVKAAFLGHEVESDLDTILSAGRVLRVRTGKPVFLTRSARGIVLFDDDGWQEVPAVYVEGPIDPTGVGDTASAAAALALASGSTSVEAALVANLAASVTIQQLGVTGAAAPDQLPARLELWHSQMEKCGSKDSL